MFRANSPEALLVDPESFSAKEVNDPVASNHKVIEPHQAVSREIRECASADHNEKAPASEAKSVDRWRKLDRLLSVSFGRISPPYLFTSFPPNR